ncbi:MAG TPA: flagellar motor switch phosphatase FliY [Coleofasciculaceae cyanobacterium]|jgi:flagellar motor switch protein FliN/FliY
MSNELNENLESILTKEDRDTVSEMSNIAMGAAGSTLAILLGQEVEIATQAVEEYPSLAAMDIPFDEEPKTLIMVQYTKGIYAISLFIMKNTDAGKLAEMMLGSTGDGAGGQLNELQMGAVGELMNQMMNSAATGLASIIHESVEISNPEVIPYTSDALAECLPQVLTESFIACKLQLKIGSEPPIELLELRTASQAKIQIGQFLSIEPGVDPDEEAGSTVTTGTISLDDLIRPQPEPEPMMASSAPRAASRPASQGATSQGTVDPVTVRPVEFSSFDHQPNVFGEENKNLELVMDVTLNLTVELGKTELSIKDVLELTRGSVIELDRVAGEPVDLMANGKLIAKGEVVVIEDNFGLRITSIVSPADRLRGL